MKSRGAVSPLHTKTMFMEAEKYHCLKSYCSQENPGRSLLVVKTLCPECLTEIV